MASNIEDFDLAHKKKLKGLSKELAEAGLKKLVQEMDTNKDDIEEPKGFSSGATDMDGNMIVELENDYHDEH